MEKLKSSLENQIHTTEFGVIKVQFEKQSELNKSHFLEILKIQNSLEEHCKLFSTCQTTAFQQYSDSCMQHQLTATQEHNHAIQKTHDAILSSPVASDKKLCGLCNEQAKLPCTQCRNMHYCSPKHQAEHWKQHNKHCDNPEVKQTADIN